ncbi:MAG TPA: di-heme-cytochrome C peroxidase, partial [Vicinamibacterales bacterium]|nr:di-heme-cytochrome C peroxidase [Vicinamibacterales bacterium]
VGVSLARAKLGGIEMIGLNCTACHVGQVQYQGHAVRVDGLGNMALINAFLKDMATETQNTLQSPRRLARFWHRVHSVRAARRARGSETGVVADDERLVNRAASLFTSNRALLEARLNALKCVPTLVRSIAISTQEGYGRLDAFGIGRDELFGCTPGNSLPADAPVSLPHIWGMEYTGWLQWGANTNSVMERNIGQALGVGATFAPSTFSSTLRIDNLHRMEQLAYKLTPPEWPASFPPVDAGKAARGKALFVQDCAGCHETYTADDAMRTYKLFPLNVVGTDPLAALNFEMPVKQSDGTISPFPYAELGLIENIKLKAYEDGGYTAEQVAALEERAIRKGPQWDPTFRAPLLDSAKYPDTVGRAVYRAKTLVGIWATGPFLHNGSVPTVYDLLHKAAERPVTFQTGTREYDTVKLGIQTDPAKAVLAPGQAPFTFDTRLPGNWNSGHEWDFYPSLTDDDRYAIVEFLKTFTSESQLPSGASKADGAAAYQGGAPVQAPREFGRREGRDGASGVAPGALVLFVIAGALVVGAGYNVTEWFMPHGEQARATEAADTAALTSDILTIQRRYAAQQNRPLGRGTHTKGMCVRATFEVFDVFSTLPDRVLAARLAHGLFARPGVYDATVRFANGESHVFPDPKKDVRACSFSVEVPAGVLGPDVMRQDFSMNNARVFPLNDAHAFAVATRVAVASSMWRGVLALRFRDKVGFVRTVVLGAMQEKPARAAFQQTSYWSTVPFHHGPADVIKYAALACPGNYATPLSNAINCLQDELTRHVNDDLQMSCFDFGLQLLDVDAMTYFGRRQTAGFWIENASVEWK